MIGLLTVLAATLVSGRDPGGSVWGRLSVEAESPDGAWIPLPGVDVSLLPFTPELAAELERVRDSARDSHQLYQSAVSRVLALVRGTPTTVTGGDRAGAPAPAVAPVGGSDRMGAGTAADGRQTTDRWGVFLFAEVPAGQWLVVAVRTSTLRTRDQQARTSSRSRDAARFTGRTATAAGRWAELWITPVRVDAGRDARVFLTDRGRWLAGPLP